MKNKFIALLLAIAASLLVSTWGSLDNVSACVQAPGCKQPDQQPIGKLTTRHYGFPAAYKTTVTFEPVNNDSRQPNYAGYAVASTDTQPLNVALIVVNIIFWLPVIYFAIQFISSKKTAAHHSAKRSSAK